MKTETKRRLKMARLFRSGYSINGVARALRVPYWEVENAIRHYLTPGGRKS